MFSVTPLYALPAAAIYLILWMRVASKRGDTGISFGDAGDIDLLRRVRQHGNCAEWTSFILILMALAEGSGASAWWLHASGVLLLIGRVMHPFGLKLDNAGHPLRYVGNSTNLLAALIALIAIGVRAFFA